MKFISRLFGNSDLYPEKKETPKAGQSRRGFMGAIGAAVAGGAAVSAIPAAVPVQKAIVSPESMVPWGTSGMATSCYPFPTLRFSGSLVITDMRPDPKYLRPSNVQRGGFSGSARGDL